VEWPDGRLLQAAAVAAGYFRETFSISRKNTENNARLHLLNFGGMKKRSIISALLKPGFRRDFSFLI